MISRLREHQVGVVPHAARLEEEREFGILRTRATRLLASFVVANVPVLALISVARPVGVAPTLACALLAVAALLLLRVPTSLGRRLAMAALATAVPMIVVLAVSPAWRSDDDTYFFVVFALLVAYADWRPIVLSEIAALAFLAATADSPQRFAFAATLAGIAGTALGWFADQLRANVVQTARSLVEARESAAARGIFESIVLKGTAGVGVFAGPDGERRLAFANGVLLSQLAYEGDPIGKTTLELVGPEMTRGLVAKLRGDLKRGEANSLEIFPWRGGGVERWFEIDAYMIAAEDGTQSLVAVTTDVTLLRRLENESARAGLAEETNAALEREITERKLVERRLAHATYHDVLTGLPNRALFTERLDLALRRTSLGPGRMPAVLFVDIDGFKVINDSLGRTVADLLLVGIARRFEGALRAGDMIARLGGDEFAILLESVDGPGAAAVAAVLQNELVTPFELGDRSVVASASIGIALGTSDYARADDVIRDADIAMHRAKALGKRRSETFASEMRTRTDGRTRIAIDLQHALARDEFRVFYQPIVSLATGRLEGFEALVRWEHPKLGLVPPNDFIAIAEETGLIVALGEWVLRTACEQAVRWRRETPAAGLAMSVNVSATQLLAPGFAALVQDVLGSIGLPWSALHLEITESALVDDPERVASELAELRALGVSISLDDFGTGYSSLTYLRAFPLDSLKIDKSFVSHRGASIGEPEIVRSLIVLAESLGLTVVAEGVETLEQQVQLRELGCAKAQGYLFAKPLPTDLATAFINESLQTNAALPA